MSKKIRLGGIVLLVAASSMVCLGQEGGRSTFRAVLGIGRAARPSAAEADKAIDQLRAKLMEQIRTSTEALRALDGVKRQLAREAAKSSTNTATRRGEDGFRALYTIDPEGSKAKYLMAAPGMISSSSPESSHDGTMIAFDAAPRHNALDEAHLFVSALEGPFKGMFKDLGCGNVPSWSPDDKQIAYMLNPGNPSGAEWGIWIMNADGSERKRLCDGWYPRFSPDGKLLHVYAPQARPASIHVIRPDGKGERQLAGRTIRVKYGGGTWSPEGNRIVFIGTRDGREHRSAGLVTRRQANCPGDLRQDGFEPFASPLARYVSLHDFGRSAGRARASAAGEEWADQPQSHVVAGREDDRVFERAIGERQTQRNRSLQTVDRVGRTRRVRLGFAIDARSHSITYSLLDGDLPLSTGC